MNCMESIMTVVGNVNDLLEEAVIHCSCYDPFLS